MNRHVSTILPTFTHYVPTLVAKLRYHQLAMSFVDSVTISGDVLDLGKFLKPLATIKFPKSTTFLAIFVKVSKSIFFLVNSFLGNFFRNLAIFSGHAVRRLQQKVLQQSI